MSKKTTPENPGGKNWRTVINSEGKKILVLDFEKHLEYEPEV